MTDWSEKIAADLKQELQGVNEKDVRFFRMEEYLRMVKRVDEFSSSCSDCKQFQPGIEAQVSSMRQALKSPGKSRRRYDQHLNLLANHMKQKHGFQQPYFFTYSYSFYYSFALAGFAFLVSLAIPSIDRWFFIVPGFILGLLGGQLQGGRKDSKVRANKKLL